MTRKEFSIPLKKLKLFQEVLGNFLGNDQFPFSVKTEADEALIPFVIRDSKLGAVVIERISLKPGENRGRWLRENHPFLYYLHQQLDTEERKKLLNYLETGGLVMLRRTRPSKEFKQALDSHCEEFHGGFALVTVLLEALERLNGINKGSPKSRESISDTEEESLENLSKISQSAIHFYPLVQSGKKFREAKKLIRQWLKKSLIRLVVSICKN